MSLMLADDWRLFGKLTGAAFAFGACLFGLVGTLLLWLEGLEGGDL